MPYDGDKTFAAKDSAKDLLGIDKTALRRTLLGPELIVLAPEVGVGQCLIRNCNLFEDFLCVWVVRVLVRMVFDRKAP